MGTTSKGVDRLEKRGWVVRQANPADRRSHLLALTEEGGRLLARAEGAFTSGLSELLESALAPSATAAEARALSHLRSALERDRVGNPTG